MKISCSLIHEDCRVGSVFYIYGKLKDAEGAIAPIDQYLIGTIEVIDGMTDPQIQAACDDLLEDYSADDYDFGLQIIDNCGQYSNFATDMTPCSVNISSITAGTVTTAVIHTDATTADGFLTLDITDDADASLMAIPEFANPNGNLPAIDFLETWRTDGNIFTLGRLNASGEPECNSYSFETFANNNVEVPTSGAAVTYSLPANHDIPSCCGTISYSLVYNASGGTIAVNGTTGLVTITAGTFANPTGWYYVQVLCTCNGRTSVIAGIGLLVTNP